eukprot:g2792.t1
MKMGAAGAAALAEAIPPQVKDLSLDLFGNKIGDDGMDLISKALPKSLELLHVVLQQNDLSRRGFFMLDRQIGDPLNQRFLPKLKPENFIKSGECRLKKFTASRHSPDMDVALFAQDVDQLSQLLGECHLHEERDALAQVMMPIASYAGQLASGKHFSCLLPDERSPVGWCSAGLQSPYASTAVASGLYADELLRRLQGCQSLDEGRATCAEMMLGSTNVWSQKQPLWEVYPRQVAHICFSLSLALSLSLFSALRMTAFHQEHSQQLLRPRVPAKAVPAQEAQEVQAAGVNELLARLQSLQGSSWRQRSRQAEETVEQLKSELQAQSEQLRASERAKALLQSRVEVLLREDFQMPQGCGRPCS